MCFISFYQLSYTKRYRFSHIFFRVILKEFNLNYYILKEICLHAANIAIHCPEAQCLISENISKLMRHVYSIGMV